MSVGVTTATPHAADAVDADTLLRDADTAMHDAKAQGGAIIGQFHDSLRSAVVYRADLERRLVGAVARREIVLAYQPIVGIPDRAVVGFEALARWKQGSAVLPPDQWIPVAESTSLIHEIGEFVLVEAGRQLMSWLDAGHHVGVSVNVSPRQLSSRRLPEAVYRLLSDGVPPELLTLEVTESVAVDEHAAGILTELRNAGVRVALDDFGTGYSALSAVSRLPIDVIKIDRSIVQRIRERDGRAVVAAVLAIAESLELQTVAEGIERLADEWFLAELGCPFGQGYLYHRPLPAAETWQLLADPAALS